jgi:hypothetical protein
MCIKNFDFGMVGGLLHVSVTFEFCAADGHAETRGLHLPSRSQGHTHVHEFGPQPVHWCCFFLKDAGIV